MKKIILSTAAIALLAAFATSCIDDSSSYGGNEIPALTISVPGDAEMPVYNFAYGTECELTPNITYTGSNELTYEWSIGTYTDGLKGELEFVSNEKTLRYFFPEGGAYYAHLNVSDGIVGLSQEFELSINRTFEQGYLVLSNNENGEGNLVFIKDLTREEIEDGIPQTILENCLQRVNPELDKSTLVDARHIQWYSFDFTIMGPVLTNRLVIFTNKEGLYLDPNTFVTTSTIPYEDVIPGFNGSKAFLHGTSPKIFDNNQKKYITFDSENMFGYEDSSWSNRIFDYIQTYTYQVYLNQRSTTYFLNLSPLVLHNRTDYFGWVTTEDILDETGRQLFTDEELIVAFKGEKDTNSNYPCQLLTKNKLTGKYYCTTLKDFSNEKITLVGHRELAVNESTSLPQPLSSVLYSDLYRRAYFYNGNKFYVMLPNTSNSYNLPSVNEAAITFPSNEEVTCFMINTDPDNNSSTTGEDMLIATVDKATGRGSIYVYDVKDIRTDNPNPTPKATYKDCADRIINISYKPRIS